MSAEFAAASQSPEWSQISTLHYCLQARTLLGLGAPGLTTRSKDATISELKNEETRRNSLPAVTTARITKLRWQRRAEKRKALQSDATAARTRS